MIISQYNRLVQNIAANPIKEKNNTWLLNFPKGIHPKDFRLTGCYKHGKNELKKGIDWNYFDSISFISINQKNSIIDAVGRVGNINYFLKFVR